MECLLNPREERFGPVQQDPRPYHIEQDYKLTSFRAPKQADKGSALDYQVRGMVTCTYQ